MQFSKLLVFHAWLSAQAVVVTHAQQPEELWKTSYQAGKVPSVMSVVGERVLTAPQGPGSLHIFSTSDGELLSSMAVPPLPGDSGGQYKVDAATPIPGSTDLLLVIGPACSSCPRRLWRYDTVNFEPVWEKLYPGQDPSPFSVAAVSSDGSFFIQFFSGPDSFRRLDAVTGDEIWNTTTELSNRRGGTMIDDTKAVFGGLGGRLTVVSTADGTIVEEYTPATPCVVDEPVITSVNDTIPPSPTQGCNDLFQRPLVSNGGDFIYIVDDLVGLSKFDATDVASGPIWTNTFATTSSQQSSSTAAISSDDSVIYATAYNFVAAVGAEDGETIWVDELSGLTSPGNVEITSEDDGVLVLTSSGTRSQANRALSGGRAWRITDSYHVTTDGTVVFSAGDSSTSAFDPFIPTPSPTESTHPSQSPSTLVPSETPSTGMPSEMPSAIPTDNSPSQSPSTSSPTLAPTSIPVASPTSQPTAMPTPSATTRIGAFTVTSLLALSLLISLFA